MTGSGYYVERPHVTVTCPVCGAKSTVHGFVGQTEESAKKDAWVFMTHKQGCTYNPRRNQSPQ